MATRRWLVAAGVAAVLVTEAVLVTPHIEAAGDALAHPRVGWILVALALEAASMTTFARLQRRMLFAGGLRVTLRAAVATTLAANALSVTLPAGPVVASGYTVRRMRGWGASPPLIGWSLVASGILSSVALAVIGLVGASLAGGSVHPVTVVLEVLAVAALIWGLRAASRNEHLLRRVGSLAAGVAGRIARRSPEGAQRRADRLVDELLTVQPRTRDWVLGLLFAALNWLADLGCLVAACHAVRAPGPSLTTALLAFAAGMAASSVPLLPGGLGVVDAAMVLTLVRGGLPAGAATAAVLLYRIISLGLVGAAGWLALVALRLRADRREAGAGAAGPTPTDAAITRMPSRPVTVGCSRR
jgi:uncharacterized protein (TIRG00374 family)